jgi:PBP1b-binding outer membrane lipoprotein LpoB
LNPAETQDTSLLADFILSVQVILPAEGEATGQLELRLVDRASGELVWRQRREIPASAFARPDTAT